MMKIQQSFSFLLICPTQNVNKNVSWKRSSCRSITQNAIATPQQPSRGEQDFPKMNIILVGYQFETFLYIALYNTRY